MILKLNKSISKFMSTQEGKTIRVQIYHPLMGPHNFEVNSKENFSDLRGLLTQTTSMTILQNFRFEVNGQSLPQFQQIGSIIPNDARINLILEPFDEKSSLYHFERVKEILADPLEWIFLNSTREIFEEREPSINFKKPEEINIDNFFDTPLTSVLTSDPYQILKMAPISFYQTFAFSIQSNPTPLCKKLTGDFYYIQLKTLEGHEHHISAGPEGFTVTNLNSSNFFTFYNLLDLLKYLSPKFNLTFASLRKKYYNPSEYERNLFIPQRSIQNREWLKINSTNYSQKKSNSFQFNKHSSSWSYSKITNPNPEHYSRDSLFIKDWNQIIQIQNISPEDSKAQISNKEKNRYKIYQDFVTFAKQTAVKVVEGKIQPVYQFEGGDGIQFGLFQYGSLIVWIAEDQLFSYSTFLQPTTSAQTNQKRQKPRISRRIINTQISNLQHLFKNQQIDASFRHTVLVRYRGYSLVVQTIVPGLPLTDFFEKQQQKQLQQYKNQKDLFFSNNFKGDKLCLQQQLSQRYTIGKSTQQDSEKNEKQKQKKLKMCSFATKRLKKSLEERQGNQQILAKLSQMFKLSLKNVYKNDQGDSCLAVIHPLLKSFQAVDHRNYVLNLFTLSPRDINYSGIDNSASVLRRQLIDKYEFDEKQTGSLKTNPNLTMFSSDVSTVNTKYNTMIDAGFRMVFSEKLSEEFLKLKNVKDYSKQKFMKECLNQFLTTKKKYLADSKSVIKVLHQNGLSSRYLGLLIKANQINQKQIKMQCPHIRIILERAILVKTLKNIFQVTMKDYENICGANGNIRYIIARLLNCLFCEDKKVLEELEVVETREINDKDKEDESSSTTVSKKKKKKSSEKKIQENQTVKNNSDCFKRKIEKQNKLWTNCIINPSDMNLLLKKLAEYRYSHTFREDFKQTIVNGSIFHKTAILRDLCLSLGIVLEKCQYFQKEGGLLFKPENILEIKPLAKHIKIDIPTLNDLVSEGDAHLENKKIQEAVQAYHIAINYITSNFGILNEKLAAIKKKIAEIYFKVGEIDAALAFLDCSIKVYERLFGVSNFKTLECYSFLSQLFFFKRNFELAEFYMMRMIHNSTVSYGQEYPELIGAYLNLSSIYEGWFRHMDSIASVTKALEIAKNVFGQVHINTVTCYSAMAAANFEVPDISKAVFFQKKSIQIMGELHFPMQDIRMKQAIKVLQFYQTLLNSKKVRENHEKQKKKLMANQIYPGFSYFPNSRDSQWKNSNIPHYMMGLPNKPFLF